MKILEEALIRVIVIDDSESDRELVSIAFEKASLQNPLHMAETGEEGLALVRRFADEKALVLLDLKLPGMEGLEVLRAIRSDPNTTATPVIVLTSSDLQEDIVRSYELSANAFLRKPVGLEGLAESIQAVDDFWLRLVRYPAQS